MVALVKMISVVFIGLNRMFLCITIVDVSRRFDRNEWKTEATH